MAGAGRADRTVTLRYPVAVTDLDAFFGQTEAEIARATTDGMNDAVAGLKNEYRDQVQAAGLGRRLAFTWQGRTYPQGANSLDPGGYVWTKAPELIDAYASGATIVPVNGRKLLAVPTANVPSDLKRRAAQSRRRTAQSLVAMVVARYGPLRLVHKGTRILGLVEAIAAKSKRGFRPASKGRVAQGRERKWVLMFVFTPAVRVRKRLDLDGPAQRWAAKVPDLIANHLANPVVDVWNDPGMVMLDSGKFVSKASLPRYSGPPSGGFGTVRPAR